MTKGPDSALVYSVLTLDFEIDIVNRAPAIRGDSTSIAIGITEFDVPQLEGGGRFSKGLATFHPRYLVILPIKQQKWGR